MALSEAQKLLDELMGRHRNANPNEKLKTMEWAEEDVCRHFLIKFCPHDLFTNTKADLGPCARVHDDRLRVQFTDEASEEYKSRYEHSFIDMCRDLLKDVDRKIQRARHRLDMTAELREQEAKKEVKSPDGERIQVLNDKISVLLKKIEELGSKGEVEEAQGLMKLCDELKVERQQLSAQASRSNNDWMKVNLEQDKSMEVCDVCGAFLIIGDAQCRVDDHLSGKQHVGYSKLRESVVEYEKRREEEERRKRERRRGKDDRRDNNNTRCDRGFRDRMMKSDGGGSDHQRSSQKKERIDRSRERMDRRGDRGDRGDRRRSRDRSKDSRRRRDRRGDRSRDRSRDRKRRSPRSSRR